MKLPSRWKGNSWIQRYSIELFLFSFSLATAYFMGWNNTDLIWSFWITSLMVGYVTIFRTTIAPLTLLAKLIRSPEDNKEFRQLPIITKLKMAIFVLFFIPISLFYIVFLSFHFCVFHLLLAYWLQMLMPHSGITDFLADANGGQFYIYFQIIKTLLLSYWIIVIEKLVFDYRTYWKSGSNKLTPVQQKFFSYEVIMRPYVQVMRILALMLLLFWLHETGINQYLIYVLIYSLFYFPIPAFGKRKVFNNLLSNK
ncbi:MAG: hypothetical protein Q8S39_07440 [Ignavibacteria bacterium]|nr:hypothetical protein [Ignavibacteria bacterium]